MSVREDEQRKNPSRGLGLAAAAISVGVGAALYYFFNKRPERPHAEGSTSENWHCEHPQTLDDQLALAETSYSTVSEHTTTDTSVHDSSHTSDFEDSFNTNHDSFSSDSSPFSMVSSSSLDERQSNVSDYYANISMNWSMEHMYEEPTFNITGIIPVQNEVDNVETDQEPTFNITGIIPVQNEVDNVETDQEINEASQVHNNSTQVINESEIDSNGSFNEHEFEMDVPTDLEINEATRDLPHVLFNQHEFEIDVSTDDAIFAPIYYPIDEPLDDPTFNINDISTALVIYDITETEEESESEFQGTSEIATFENVETSHDTGSTVSFDETNDWDVTNTSLGVPALTDMQTRNTPLSRIYGSWSNMISSKIRTRSGRRLEDLTEEEQMAILRQEAFRERSWSLEECSICFEVMLKDQSLMQLPCAHNFHVACIGPWLQEQQTCPNCRKSAE